MSTNEEEEEAAEREVTIEDVVDCRIILVRRVGTDNFGGDTYSDIITKDESLVQKETVLNGNAVRGCCHETDHVGTGGVSDHENCDDRRHCNACVDDQNDGIEGTMPKETTSGHPLTATIVSSDMGDYGCGGDGPLLGNGMSRHDTIDGNDNCMENCDGDHGRGKCRDDLNLGIEEGCDRGYASERAPCQKTHCHDSDEIFHNGEDEKASVSIDIVEESMDGKDVASKILHDGDCERVQKSAQIGNTMYGHQDNRRDLLLVEENSDDTAVSHHDCAVNDEHSIPGDNPAVKVAVIETTCQSEEVSCDNQVDGNDTKSFDNEEETDHVRNVDYVDEDFTTKEHTAVKSFFKSEDVEQDKGDPLVEENYIEILDSSDSDNDQSKKKGATSSAKCQHSGNQGISITIDDASCDDSCKVEHVADCDCDDDDDDVEFIGVNISLPDAKDERKRKVQEEERRAQEAQDNLERKIRQAREKRAKKVSEMNKRTSQPPQVFTMPNFTFYTGNATTKRRKQSNKNKEKKSHSSTTHRFNYMGDDAAFLEQERLLRESAARVKAQESIQRMLQMSRGGMQFYREPVQDVSTLPKDHYKWTDLYSRLGVPQRASFDIVKKNYRKLCLLYHPDKAQSNSKEDQDRFQAIKEAYETISASLGK
jgi:DnaJ-class molecular chaperone with C-terminal Zn finger domain